MTVAIFLTGSNLASGQDQPKPKKDTVNIDTDAKPQFYYAEEDEATEKKGNFPVAAIVAVVIAVIGSGYFLTKKKK